jgi:uncharacterized SAM-binding protein YcdF (DUF218 family)
MFFLKKLVAAFLMPLPICLGVAAVGLGLLWFTKRQRLGKILVTTGFVLIALLGLDVVSRMWVSPLERAYRPRIAGAPPASDERARQARWIVVLGGGHRAAPGIPPTSQLSQSALSRIIEAVRLKRQLPQAKLIVSGSAPGDPVSVALLYARTAELLGVPPADIVSQPQSIDTDDEARAVRRQVGDAPVILVTSASHLPRAVGLFRKQGVDAVPSPADYVGLAPRAPTFLPAAAPLNTVEKALHEYLGMLFAKLRGQM